ncbi:MAG: type II toxin-antitoxin system RelE/ParE family toxin [Chloroflexi bacterium]|nr:type II toxin-antitoxin system RelE/ParE family toxin [Chloroflexota bacterium]
MCYNLQLGLPYVKHLEGKLWELRIRAGRKAYRVIYFAFTGQRFILLHAFLKKTQKTPRKQIAIAQRRLADFLEYEGAA